MNEITVSIKVQSDAARTVLNSIRPEIESDEYGRSKVELSYEKELILKITSPDLHAMRAAANTYLRWLDMCLKLAK
jgi:tRNA threonylcarbamoyladenosine modification (KEOPS) complex  Pcc1 subunit